MTQASKEQASLEKAYNLYKEYKALLDGIEEAKELLNETILKSKKWLRWN